MAAIYHWQKFHPTFKYSSKNLQPLYHADSMAAVDYNYGLSVTKLACVMYECFMNMPFQISNFRILTLTPNIALGCVTPYNSKVAYLL